MQPSVVLDDSAVGHSAVPAGEPGDCAFDHWPMPAVGGLEVGVGGAFTVFTLEQIVLVQLDGAALLAVVHRARNGQCAHAIPKTALRLLVIRLATPAGQVNVPATASWVKSSMVKPPSTAGLTGQGLTSGFHCL